jgi:hypothetical protein
LDALSRRKNKKLQHLKEECFCVIISYKGAKDKMILQTGAFKKHEK